MSTLSVLPTIDNPKGELQELLQALSPEAPRYSVASITGPDHDRVFECTVRHSGKELARGRGKSKKEAESDAALAALTLLREQKKAQLAAEAAPAAPGLADPLPALSESSPTPTTQPDSVSPPPCPPGQLPPQAEGAPAPETTDVRPGQV
jgi:hypothetical protein